jgi:hypothetical protein
MVARAEAKMTEKRVLERWALVIKTAAIKSRMTQSANIAILDDDEVRDDSRRCFTSPLLTLWRTD